jgi:release factor glutamine methyltransferase
MRLGELRRQYRQLALEHRLNPRDIDLLLADAVGRDFSYVLAFDDAEVDETTAARFAAQAERRFAGEPVQYIRGRTEFYGREFSVDSRVLIPRPETELVVEEALRRISPTARVIDVCTGSGCIASTIALERTGLQMFACDLSVGALIVAQQNARSLGAKVRFTAGDVLSHVGGRFDVITANPPYVPAAHVEGLQTEVRSWEPTMALTPGKSGTEVIERLFAQALPLITDEGFLIFEIGYSQSEEVAAIGRAAGWKIIDIVADLAAIPRVVVSCRA